MQIAIDGPAGAGKSTIAKKIAKIKKMTYLDTGAMYRCITYAILDAGLSVTDKEGIINFTKQAEINFQNEKVFCNGRDVTEAIRTSEVSKYTSDIASIKEVRELLVSQQRKIAKNQSVIMDGRDIGSVVLPQADLKIFLDANILERAKRRKVDLDQAGNKKSLESIKKDIEKRDCSDRSRMEGPLIQVEDAMVVDTTGKTIDDVCEIILNYIGEVEK
jgi:cytidylate kinase